MVEHRKLLWFGIFLTKIFACQFQLVEPKYEVYHGNFIQIVVFFTISAQLENWELLFSSIRI